MDIKEQIILEYLEQGCGYRKLQEKYGISRTTICKRDCSGILFLHLAKKDRA